MPRGTGKLKRGWRNERWSDGDRQGTPVFTSSLVVSLSLFCLSFQKLHTLPPSHEIENLYELFTLFLLCASAHFAYVPLRIHGAEECDNVMLGVTTYFFIFIENSKKFLCMCLVKVIPWTAHGFLPLGCMDVEICYLLGQQPVTFNFFVHHYMKLFFILLTSSLYSPLQHGTLYSEYRKEGISERQLLTSLDTMKNMF